MTHKRTLDKKTPGYPLTARQKRQADGGRKSRKVERHKLERSFRVKSAGVKRAGTHAKKAN